MLTDPVDDTDTVLDADLGDQDRTLEDLLDSVAHGDERAFALFYDQLAKPVMGMVNSIVRDHALTEEIVQEVFVELWRTAPRYRPDRGTARAWAMTIAHHRAVDRVRSTQTPADRKRAAHVRDHPGTDYYDSVVEELPESLERRQIREGLRTLTDLERESILLAYYRALTYRQVAETLSVATGTVQYRMRAGLRQLRDHLTHDTSSATKKTID